MVGLSAYLEVFCKVGMAPVALKRRTCKQLRCDIEKRERDREAVPYFPPFLRITPAPCLNGPGASEPLAEATVPCEKGHTKKIRAQTLPNYPPTSTCLLTD